MCLIHLSVFSSHSNFFRTLRTFAYALFPPEACVYTLLQFVIYEVEYVYRHFWLKQ